MSTKAAVSQESNLVDPSEIRSLIVDSIQDLKGSNIVQLDLSEIDDASTDCFIICEAESSTKIRAITEKVVKTLRDTLEIRPNHLEGSKSGTWVLIDYFDTVVHVFYPETRAYYNLEDLWMDAKKTVYENS